ncbi:hypothetical protein A6283_15055 [Bacillus wiedmannii]|nr:hypothetical protein A6283_15055 [Bacillus wiedmannii]
MLEEWSELMIGKYLITGKVDCQRERYKGGMREYKYKKRGGNFFYNLTKYYSPFLSIDNLYNICKKRKKVR